MSDDQALEDVLKKLSGADLRSLYGRLGAYTEQFDANPGAFATFDANVPIECRTAGAMDEAVALGKSIIAKWNHALYGVVCSGESKDIEARKSILDSLGVKSADVLAASLTGVLVSSFGVAPAIAVVIAVILARILLPATVDGICEYWKQRV
jgi:hypothetical protein